MATARPRPQVMRLSEAAAIRIKELMAKSDRPIAGLRVGVKNGGCAGMEYTMEYVDSIGPADEVVEDAVAAVAGVSSAKVSIVWEPPWDQSRMTDEARLVLNMW